MSSTPHYLLARRQGPLVISIPHLGRTIPQDLRARYSSRALELEDTDWHLDRLYAFAEQLGATVIAATVSRYVIDLNRPATGESLYPE
jgi:N-formylglutamate deformylase